ncbi:MAG: hypothetical protein LBS36_08515 [Oscillospiraceae bacterium]|jgi:energy-coupling factor transporter ATP-binding protein EcfA2|nr:hypothetical protein [Oscillospiraceae bacterium]
MITLLTGTKGSGKTKKMLEMLDSALENSKGNVVCVEKQNSLSHNVSYRARLISADEFSVCGFGPFFGFLSGLCAGNHDITDIFVDATLRIGSRDMDELADFIKKIDALAKMTETRFVFTVSADKENIPADLFDLCDIA